MTQSDIRFSQSHILNLTVTNKSNVTHRTKYPDSPQSHILTLINHNKHHQGPSNKTPDSPQSPILLC
jgi:hypothetical protein